MKTKVGQPKLAHYGDVFMSILSNNLCWLRKLHGYTQDQLAKALNMDRSTYSYYESQKTTPSISNLITICRLFQVSMDQMVSDDLTQKHAKNMWKKDQILKIKMSYR